MNDNKPKRKIKWLPIILIILILILFIWLIWNLLNPAPIETNIDQLGKFITEAITSPTDDKYFSSIIISDFQRKLLFTYNGQNYIIGLPQGGADILWEYFNSKNGVVNGSNLNLPPLPEGSHPLFYFKENLNYKPSDPNNSFQYFSAGMVKATYVVQESIWYKLLVTFGPMLLLFLLMWFLYRAQMKAGGGIFNPGKNQAQKIISDKKFSDIAGNEEVKEEVKELVDYLKNPTKYSAAGARIPKGILLGGPPGTGKTLIAKATAGEANVPFYFISGSNFVEMYVGVGAKRVRELFKDARKEAPAIIFIDEIDAVGRSRGAGIGGGNDEREQTLNQLLVEMDGMAENSGILIMAATNRTDVLDPALLRPGRFDRTITVNLPDIKEREEILKLHAKGKRIDPEVTFANLAKRTPGYSGAQLENVINEAALLSVRENTGVITKLQIDEAIDRVMSGPAKKTRTISPEELTMVAYHEAGHAVVGLKVPGGNKVQKITIIPRGNAGGYNLMLPEKEKYNKTKLELESMIKSYMGGRAAEEIIYGKENISTGAADDIQRATSIARRMVTEWGMSSLGPIQYEEPEGSVFLGRDYTKSKFTSDALSNEIDTEVRKIITSAQKEAKKVIEDNKKLLELIKTLLLKKETIVAEEIEYIEKNMKLPPEEEIETKKENFQVNIDEILETVEHETPKNKKNTKEIEVNKETKTKTTTVTVSKKKSNSNKNKENQEDKK
ncbi:ATP-dependent zinc metalloprotease FtsH [Metamycoplasma sualvi]|uniref:ATP-dependent zinc metalloprotease FtsH n=1 Tax=Metamycoplasma sualvi TaxID=2125 RepID=UPI003873C48C